MQQGLAAVAERIRRTLIDVIDQLGLGEAARTWSKKVSPSRSVRRDGRDVRHIELIMAAVVGPDDLVVDVGANVGTISRAAVRVAPSSPHLLFEPLPELAGRLRTEFPTCAVHEIALADRSGEATFVRVVERPTRSGLRPGQVKTGMRTSELPVQTATLDEILGDASPRLVKIDVEGTELEVLKGAARTLRHARPVVIFEHQPEPAELAQTAELFTFLTEHAYRIYDIDGKGPLSERRFVEVCRRARIWNFLAV